MAGVILTSSRGLQQLEQQVGHLTTQYAHITADYTALDRPEKRLAIYLRDDMACIYCGIGIEEAGTLTLDHVRPHSQGGSNAASNLVTACRRCTSARGVKSVRAFVGRPAVTRVRRQTRQTLPLAEARRLIASRG